MLPNDVFVFKKIFNRRSSILNIKWKLDYRCMPFFSSQLWGHNHCRPIAKGGFWGSIKPPFSRSSPSHNANSYYIIQSTQWGNRCSRDVRSKAKNATRGTGAWNKGSTFVERLRIQNHDWLLQVSQKLIMKYQAFTLVRSWASLVSPLRQSATNRFTPGIQKKQWHWLYCEAVNDLWGGKSFNW